MSNTASTGDPRAQQVVMLRPHLEDLPELALPAAYSIRPSLPGDEKHWCRLISAAFPEGNGATLATWKQQILNRNGYAPDCVFFIIAENGDVCATASAMRSEHPEQGYLHWVATSPQHTGKKLGKMATLQTLHYFKQTGYRSATLHTESFRIAAVHSYLQLGFLPHISEEKHIHNWQLIAEQLRYPLPDAINDLSS